MRLPLILAGFFVAALSSSSLPAALEPAALKKADLTQRFLLQINYEQGSGHEEFKTSRSRVVSFRRHGAVLHMVDVSEIGRSERPPVLATIPIRHETDAAVAVDLNEAFDTVYFEEDRTGED